MSLTEYRRKRVFSNTPEPEPAVREGEGQRFFIQRHSARRLHYDLRLEMEGVLKSWALPNGPTLDPAIKRLAVHVEDHPLDYGTFEGTIPGGNYGAGQVTLWDRGTYEWAGTKTPAEQWEAGDLKFRLHGRKLLGEFALVRTKQGKGKAGRSNSEAWLLIKKKDFAVRPGWEPESDIRSILPGNLDLSAFEGAVQASLPASVAPMLAVIGDAKSMPTGADWVYEVKWDGVRALIFVDQGHASIHSRKGTLIEKQYPELLAITGSLEAQSAILDGEIVCFDEHGVPSFQLLQNRIGAGAKSAPKLAQAQPACYFAFDLLYLNGHDLRTAPLVERKQLLSSILQPNTTFRYSEHFIGKGAELLEAVRERGLEGIVAKQAYSKYESKRCREWVKIKVVNQQDFVICGMIEGEREYFGALALAVVEAGKLVYAGNVGSGFTQESLKAVYEKLKPLITTRSPLPAVPKDVGKVVWLKPELVCTAKFNSWTDDYRLRGPVFLGLREDQSPEECVRETGTAAPDPLAAKTELLPQNQTEVALTVEDRRLKFTNLNKVYYPQEGYTKRDVINFYNAVAGLLVPYLQGRPLSLKRYPDGIAGEYFFQKEAPAGAPEWLRTEAILTDTHEEPRSGNRVIGNSVIEKQKGAADKIKQDDKKTTRFVIVDDRPSLLYLANLGCIDQNPAMGRVESLENPDFMLIDLDPYHCGYDRIIEAALLIRERLEQIGLTGHPKTTGGNGMHIYVPVEPIYTFQQTRTLAEVLARWVAGERPDLFTTPRTVAAREKGKVYFDYLQNASGKTISAPYVLRAYPGAPVATPLAWHEVRPGLKPTQFHIGNAVRRFERTGDLFEGVLKKPQRIEAAVEKITGLIGGNKN
ncbi:MAG TPA: non-homologous end-joining DNA ligase [Candidatus Saccharimonadales bacterium]|jgi:bifunctional non-homologous end joining protein LigD|nr:non-homologous end-joining DNA ligase [Candidatus Saccharimonadales bacterium]